MPEALTPNVAIIGCGIMGNAIATRLLECGLAVFVFDTDGAKIEALVQKGANSATSARDAFSKAPYAITSLNAPSIVRQAVFGAQGLAEAADSSKLIIDMSSIDPEATVALASELLARTGARWVDAPLSGGAPAALAGRLTVMAGGAAEDVQSARAVMDHLCAQYTHMGPSGAGQTTKLINQLLCAFAFQAVAEAVRLAELGGVAAHAIPQALAGGRADGRILQEYMAKFASRDYTPTGRIDNMLKDLEGIAAFTARERAFLPVTAHITQLHRQMVEAGLGAEDSAAMMKMFTGFKQ